MKYSTMKLVAKVLLGKDKIGNNINILDDDMMIVSYPKSGNTWLRFLIANAISEESATFENIEKIIPDIYQNYNKYLLRLSSPRILKSHEPFNKEYKKVLYIVRDPRDIILSYYRYHKKKGSIELGLDIEEYTKIFIRQSVTKIEDFGTWGENVGSWVGAKEGRDDFKLIRYEDLRRNTSNILAEVLTFLGINYSKKSIIRAVKNSSIDNMRVLEQFNNNSWVSIAGSDPGIPFIGPGEVGGWRSNLSIRSVQLIEKSWPELMAELGYMHA